MPDDEPSPAHIVILIHGIRDFALWQVSIRSTLEKHGFKVEDTNYGRFNLLQFLIPISYFRRKAVDKVWDQIRIIRKDNASTLLSVIAHSFGTYVIAHLMQRNFDIKFNRIILCGSVLQYDFPFEQFQDRYTRPIVNEVGTRDIWPALAESVTGGYGSAGTYGFHRPLVRDRWHNGAHHSFFLSEKFAEHFWIPFFENGAIIPGADSPERPRVWLQILSVMKIKYLFGVTAIGLGLLVAIEHAMPPQGFIGCYADRGDQTGTSGRDLDGFFVQQSNLTLEKCIGLCASQSFSYAGTQFGNSCFCGKKYGKFGKSDACNNPCAGDSSEICGGYWANSVYGTGRDWMR